MVVCVTCLSVLCATCGTPSVFFVCVKSATCDVWCCAYNMVMSHCSAYNMIMSHCSAYHMIMRLMFCVQHVNVVYCVEYACLVLCV